MLEEFPYPRRSDLLVGALLQHGSWLTASLDTAIHWPTSTCSIQFRGREVFVLPATKDERIEGDPYSQSYTFPALAVQLEGGLNEHDARVLIFHLISSLTWINGQRAMVEGWGGGSLPYVTGHLGSPPARYVTKAFHHPYLPDPTDQEARWAMAFFREGLSLNHPAYQALSYFKVLNIFLPDGPAIKRWINEALAILASRNIREGEAIRKLLASGIDVGTRYWISIRCAVAHAGASGPMVDPENPGDLKRLYEDLPILRLLAEHAIESHFGVQTAMTVYHNHLHELAGFKAVLGLGSAEGLKAGRNVRLRDILPVPNLSIELLGEEKFPYLQNLSAQVIGCQSGIIFLSCVSCDGRLVLSLALDFPNERLDLHAFGIGVLDDGSVASASARVDVLRFQLAYLMNGSLHVYASPSHSLIARCDAYVPENIDMGRSVENYQERIAEAEVELRRRSVGR